MSRYALEALLRPPVEFYSTVTAGCSALICLTQAPLLMLTPWQARLMACAMVLLALRRGWPCDAAGRAGKSCATTVTSCACRATR